MKNGIILLAVAVVVIAAIIFVVVNLPNNGTGPVQGDGGSGNTLQPVSSGTTDSGDALIELTPTITEGKLLVNFAINTHSVALDQFDLKEIATLEYNGKSAKPVSASSLSGHHSYGNMVFNVDDKLSSFTIRIKGISKDMERVFKWQ